jgi:biopolymer transport protein ExbB/TolQ
MYLDNYEIVMIVILSGCSLILLIVVGLGIFEFRKSNKEFEEILREKRRMNNQLKRK